MTTPMTKTSIDQYLTAFKQYSNNGKLNKQQTKEHNQYFNFLNNGAAAADAVALICLSRGIPCFSPAYCKVVSDITDRMPRTCFKIGGGTPLSSLK